MSGLRCKPGELAVVVSSSTRSNIGKIVRCIEFDEIGYKHSPLYKGTGPVWRVDQMVIWRKECGGVLQIPYATDEILRPLRGGEGEDETLQWAGLPQPAKQPVPV